MEKQYTINQVADILGLTVRTVRDWRAKGKIKAKKYPNGRIWLVSKSELERLQKEMR